MKLADLIARRDALAPALAEYRALDNEIRDRETRKNLRPYVGRFFKYRNSYGSGAKWWLYAHVTGIDAYSLCGVQFQTDNDGRSDVKFGSLLSLPNGGWTEITPAEYAAARTNFIDTVLATIPEVTL